MWKKADQEAYRARFARHADELKWLYCELYGQRMDELEAFYAMMEEAAKARKKELRLMDAKRMASPGWYTKNEQLGMMLYVGNFAKTLDGVRQKLDYVEECGVNYLHLMPLLESPEGRSDGGYAVSDFRSVQPELGTMADLEALADDCRARGISLCLDFVMNHTSEEHAWAKRARAGEAEYQNRYFFYDNWEVPHQFEQTVPQVFPTSAPGNFTWLDDCQKIVMTTFWPYQWDLNYQNPVVLREMCANMLYLANRGIDVIRIDAVPYIWKQLGTSCRNLPQVHTIVRMLRMVCEIVCPGVLLLGEVMMEPEKVTPYFGTPEKQECHMLYNVTTMCTTWHTLATHDVRLLQKQMNLLAALPKNQLFLNYLRCHDDIGWGLDYEELARDGIDQTAHKRYLNAYFCGEWKDSLARGERYNDDPHSGDARLCGTTASLCGVEGAMEWQDEEALRQALDCDVMLHAYLFTQSGIPVLYSGDEIAALNDNTYRTDLAKQSDSRYLHRGDFDWTAAQKRFVSHTREQRVFTALRRLEKLRAAHPVFDAKASLWTISTRDTAVLGVMRAYRGERLLALFNFSNQSKRLSIAEAGDFVDLLTEKPANPSRILLRPYGFCWLLESALG